jgi:hypothetical protein
LSTTSTSGLEPPPAAIASRVTEVRARLVKASELECTGDRSALEAAHAERKTTEELGYAPLHAEVLVHEARALDGGQTADARRKAEGLYFDALRMAEGSSHHELAAEIWSRLVLLAVRMDSDSRQAHARWRRYAAAVERIDARGHAARLDHLRAEIHCCDGEYAEAERCAARAIDGASEDEPERRRYIHARAKSLEAQGKTEEAVGLYESAPIHAGPPYHHNDYIALQINHAIALKKRKRFAEARNLLRGALDRLHPERKSSLDAGIVHTLLSDLGYEEANDAVNTEADGVANQGRKLEEALRHGHQALAIYQQSGAPAHRIAEAYTCIANAEFRCGKYCICSAAHFEIALQMYRTALTLRAQLPRTHHQVVVNHGSIAETLVELKRPQEAKIHLAEIAYVLAPDHQRDPGDGNAYSQEVRDWICELDARVRKEPGEPRHGCGHLTAA